MSPLFRRARRAFVPLLQRALTPGVLLRAIGAGSGMAIMMALSAYAGLQLEGVPFTTSIVLVMAVPEAEFARPRNVIFGHILCAACGVGAEYLPDGPWQVPIAVGGSVLLMLATHTLHPPTGINALLPVTHDFGWGFVLYPVAIGAVLLVAYAVAFARFVRWLRPHLPGPSK